MNDFTLHYKLKLIILFPVFLFRMKVYISLFLHYIDATVAQRQSTGLVNSSMCIRFQFSFGTKFIYEWVYFVNQGSRVRTSPVALVFSFFFNLKNSAHSFNNRWRYLLLLWHLLIRKQNPVSFIVPRTKSFCFVNIIHFRNVQRST